MDITKLTITQYHDALKEKKFSVTEGVSAYLENAKNKNPELHAFLSIEEDKAIEQAQVLDKKMESNIPEDVLYGIPLAIKDNIFIEGMQATAASKILGSYTATYDATVIKKLKKSDVVFIGKTNLDEFAMGSSTENSAFGPTRHPLDTNKVPGGSSGGSAAAVAAYMALGSLGSDTGGSIRQPAAFCGIVGLKPTYGAVSRHGAIALASSLDQIGPFAHTVEDAAYIFNAIKGKDVLDATSRESEDLPGFDDKKAKEMTIGIPEEYLLEGMDVATRNGISETIESFRKDGFKIKPISLPHMRYALSCYYIILPAEASSNLARYDGIRYSELGGMENKKLLEKYISQRGEGFGMEPKRRILLGAHVLSSGYYDAYYAKAQKVRRLILEDFLNAYKEVDIILMPTVPNTAFNLGEKVNDPLAMYLEDVFTLPVNLAGIPSVSIPTRKTFSKENMPVGFQLMGKHFEEYDILNVGNYFERHLQHE